MSRIVRLVHRAAEGSLLALQLLLAPGALAMRPAAPGVPEPVCSPRQVLLAIGPELYGLLRHGHQQYFVRLQQAPREERPRTSAQTKRPWPRRKPHQAPKPPQILLLSVEKIALISQLETTAA